MCYFKAKLLNIFKLTMERLFFLCNLKVFFCIDSPQRIVLTARY